LQLAKSISIVAFVGAAACGPIASIPPVSPYTQVLAPDDSGAILARTLAPVLYLQRDETFPLERVVAVLHPTKPVIAYHLLWKDDAHGAWVPLTMATDEEVIWVGYDSTGAPTHVWTYWHGTVLHASWPRRQVAIDVQWGKHGSIPRGAAPTLPFAHSLGVFYAMTYMLPDYWLGNMTRAGPWCFCHGYRRYNEFTTPLLLTPRITAVVRAERPEAVLHQVFGKKYSGKRLWPWLKASPDERGYATGGPG
jgi:hypothetical protein